MAASKSLNPEQRRERARKASEARWSKDPSGLDRYVEQVVRRAPALTQTQRDRLAVILGGGDAA